MTMGRREFLKVSASITAGAALSSDALGDIVADANSTNSRIPLRTLGKTRRKLSVIGFGGIVVKDLPQDQADRVVATAVERGVCYFDVAPSYGDAQQRLGPALKPFRNSVFLSCKSAKRTKAEIKQELEQSLKDLQTDHLDLYQLHAITDIEKDVDVALGKDGAIEILTEAKKQGRILNIGFSAHSPKAALKAMNEFDFDTIMYPVNFASNFASEFDAQVLKEAKKRNMGIIAIKAMAKQTLAKDLKPDQKKYPKCWYEPIDDPQLAQLAFTWTLSQGVTAALPPGQEQLFQMALDFIPKIKPLTENDIERLRQFASGLNPVFPVKT